MKANAREGLAVPASYLTPAVVLIYIVKSLTVVSVIEERYNLRKKENIHCHLRYGYFVVVNQIAMTTVAFL